MNLQQTITILYTLLFTFLIHAQEFKFGKISNEELLENVHSVDSSAVAAYLYKSRKTYYTYTENVGLALVTEVHERVKVYSKDGFDYATKIVDLGKNGSTREIISKIKGTTYTMENGKLMESKLEKSGVFKSEYSEYWDQAKITMPNVKEGSVLEYKYKITSPFIQSIDEFRFQESIPINRLVATMSIFDYFKFNQRQKGFLPLNAKTTRENNPQLKTTNVITSFELTNVPSLKDESFVSNLDNYRAGVVFEIVSLQIPGQTNKRYAQSWEDVVKSVYKSSSFGNELNKSNYFEEDLELELSGVVDKKERIQKVLDFVRNKVVWNKNKGVGAEKGVKKAYKEHKGNTGDINLMLVAMLKHAGVKAYPIVLGTRDKGVSLFPTLRGFNYVVAGIKNGDKFMLLDATEKFSDVDVLPMRDLNYIGRAIEEDGNSVMVDLIPKKKAVETTMLNLTINDDGSVEGESKQRFSKHYAMLLRNRYSDNTEDTYIEYLEDKYNDLQIDNFEIENVNESMKPLNQSFEVFIEDGIEKTSSKLYFSPLFYLTATESPFKSEKREFPIDFGFPWQDRCIVKVTLPQGYQVESLPSEAIIALPNGIGNFKYTISKSESALQLSSTVLFNKSLITSENYGDLKEFYRQIIEKHNEKVVLSKI